MNTAKHGFGEDVTASSNLTHQSLLCWSICIVEVQVLHIHNVHFFSSAYLAASHHKVMMIRMIPIREETRTSTIISPSPRSFRIWLSTKPAKKRWDTITRLYNRYTAGDGDLTSAPYKTTILSCKAKRQYLLTLILPFGNEKPKGSHCLRKSKRLLLLQPFGFAWQRRPIVNDAFWRRVWL